MTRTRVVVIAVLVCAFAGFGNRALAQTPTPDGWVVLPVDEYRALRARALPEPSSPAVSPVEATLTRIDYELRAEGDAVTGRALLTIDVLRDGWTRVQIPAGLMVRDARIDGQPLSLIEGPPPHVLLSRAGRVVLTLDIVIPLAASAGTESISLPASAAPISRATLILPRTGVDLSVSGGFVGERAEALNESRWTAFGSANQALTFSWKRKVDDRRAELPLRLRARVTSLVGLGEEVTMVSAIVRIEVLQGLAREVSVALPAGLVVNQVNGSTVGDWDTASGVLRVRLLDPITSETSFVIQGESRLPAEGVITVPLVRVPAAEREIGGVAVDVAGAGEIARHLAKGMEPGDVSDLGDIVAGRESPSMVAFRMRPLAGSEPRSLDVSVRRYTPQAVFVANVEEARYRALVAEDGRLLVEARYAVRNNQRSFLKVTLPPGATIWNATVAGRPVRPGVSGPDAVLIALEKGRAGEAAPTFLVELIYLQPIAPWIDKASAQLFLPSIDLPVSRTGFHLFYSPRFRVALQPGAFRLDNDPGPFAEAFRHPPVRVMAAAALVDKTATGMDALIDRFKNETGGRIVAGILPVNVTFPSLGPSMFLASELTAESRIPSIDLTVRRTR